MGATGIQYFADVERKTLSYKSVFQEIKRQSHRSWYFLSADTQQGLDRRLLELKHSSKINWRNRCVTLGMLVNLPDKHLSIK